MRSSLSLLLATGLVLGPAAPALAAQDIASTATTGAIALELFGEVVDPLLVLGATDAATGTLRSATAGTGAVELLGVETPFGATSAVSDGAVVRDPATGEPCALPVTVASELRAGVLCAAAYAEKDAADGPVADAASSLATSTVDVGALAGLVAEPLADLVDGLRVQVLDELLTAATTTLADTCTTLDLPDLGDGVLPDGLVPIDLLEDLVPPAPAVPLATDAASTLGSLAPVDVASDVRPSVPPCLLLQSQVGTVQDTLASVVDRTALVTALADLGTVMVTVEDAVSTAGPTSIGHGSAALLGLLEVRGPSLAPLVAAVEGLLAGLETDLTSALEEAELLAAIGEAVLCGDACPVQDVIDAADAATPDVGAEVTAVLAALRTALAPVLDSADDLLLSLTVGGSQATSEYDATTGEIRALGELGVVELGVSPALAFLLDVAGETPVGALVEEATATPLALAEGTPLASSISLGAVGEPTALTDVDGLEGLAMTVGGAQVHALQGVLGGIVVQAGDVRAASFAGEEVLGVQVTPDDADPAPAAPATGDPAPTGDTPELPNTGGGAALAAIAAIGLAAFLRRRRD